MKKKLLALLLAGAMVMGLSMTAMAGTDKTDTLDYTNNSVSENTVDVTIKTPAPGKVYSVEVDWDALVFEYDFGDAATWDPETHTYKGATPGGWTDDTATVTITNHSNDSVTVKTQFDNNTTTSDTVYNVYAKIADDSKVLASGDGLLPSAADKLVSKITVYGTPTISQGFKVDDIQVVITPVTP